ncbi:TIGR03905 family TSCPD domain-containing protein [Eubacterium maltosivorans]|uniref:TIGR03905 family TSCPD domain-containing protein n=1 Tax=Eubacterium maltosivorans TaxID=2041044 RepID=UPI000942EFC1|nr:TIGR03905 family TSCPD domain-containing protein [Eubacterium maltosivorans]
MRYHYQTKKVCPSQIAFDLENGVVKNVVYSGGGCNGNLQAVPILVDGMAAEWIISKCSGINCNGRGTSCADQLACALKKAVEE